MGQAIDRAGIQFRMLNKSRAQVQARVPRPIEGFIAARFKPCWPNRKIWRLLKGRLAIWLLKMAELQGLSPKMGANITPRLLY